MYGGLNKLSEYIYFCISINITSNAFCLFLKSSQAFSLSLSDLLTCYFFKLIYFIQKSRLQDTTLPVECALKVFKTTLNEFKTREKYIKEDHRFRDRFSKQNPRKIIRLWAEKEYRNLKRYCFFSRQVYVCTGTWKMLRLCGASPEDTLGIWFKKCLYKS